MAPKAKKNAATKKKASAKPKSSSSSAALADDRPLTLFDYRFCQGFVATGKQVDAYRELRPDAKDPHTAAYRMMQRPEILQHIRSIYAEIAREKQRAAAIAARATLLSLDVADDRLMEILQTRRKTRGEMFSKDMKMLMVKGAVPMTDEDGNVTGYGGDEAFRDSLEEGAAVDDKDLLQAVKLAYDRRGGIIKAEKAQAVGPTTTLLFKPKWLGHGRPPMTLEAQS